MLIVNSKVGQFTKHYDSFAYSRVAQTENCCYFAKINQLELHLVYIAQSKKQIDPNLRRELMRNISRKYVHSKFMDIDVYTFPLQVKDVAFISYVAVRGKDDIEGAVQRVLNKRRISSIKAFILAGNHFFNTFILNWTEKQFRPSYKNGEIKLPISSAAAQLIDGQHRLWGLREAIEIDPEIGEQDILVSLCMELTTSQAAKIFLNINTEQRPAPRSLIYDLFGEVEDDIDHVINRANDIATELNENPESPYYQAIKYPGAARGAGIIDLSAIVSSLKAHLTPEGAFARNNLRSLNYQKQTVLNYFQAIRYYYDKQGIWTNRGKNPFLRSAGFYGAIDYLTSTLLSKCADKKSFTENSFREILSLDAFDLLVNEDIKQLDGKTARKHIAEYLNRHQQSSLPEQEDYEF